MASEWQTIIDAIIADLTTEVPQLRDAITHRFEWTPEELVAAANERHLAVWPPGEDAENATPFVTDQGAKLTKAIQILYWEPAGDESSRGVEDEEAALDLYELHEAIRARFFKTANVRLGGTSHTGYLGVRFATRSGQVRWMQLGVQVETYITAT